jgi:hypothetical protein
MQQQQQQQQQRRSPVKPACAPAAEADDAGTQQPIVIVIRDNDASLLPPPPPSATERRKKTLRVGGSRTKKASDDPVIGDIGSGGQASPEKVGESRDRTVALAFDAEKENRLEAPVDATTTTPAAAAAAGMAGWIKRPGAARKAPAAAQTGAKQPRAPRTRRSTKTDAAATESEGLASSTQASAEADAAPLANGGGIDASSSAAVARPATLRKRGSRRNVKKQDTDDAEPYHQQQEQQLLRATAEFVPASSENETHSMTPSTDPATAQAQEAAAVGKKGRGRGRVRSKPTRESKRGVRCDDAEETSDLTTPTSSQEELPSASPQQSGSEGEGRSPSQRRSGRLQLKRDAALDKIREQENAMALSVSERRQNDQSPACSGSEGSDGHSSPGEQGWMWKSKAGRKSGTEKGERRLASVKPRHRSPVAALPFSIDPSPGSYPHATRTAFHVLTADGVHRGTCGA